ncbi:MAG: hypothetical protein SNJ59_05285 [Aggregatilineales bacterium]
MAKLTRRNAILPAAASTLLFSFLLFAHLPAPSSAQQAPPAQPDATAAAQTLDAAVSVLFTQTAEAKEQIAPTLTVQAAFEVAMTVTAAAPPALAQIPLEALRVISVQKTDLIAGPMNTTAVLSPDGTRFAHTTRDRLCIYTIDVVEQSCANLLAHDELGVLDPESIYWSPDGSWLTFTSRSFQYFRDSDIWVMNANTGALANLTDDGTNTGLFQPDADGYLDVSPRWLPDGRIVFLRYAFFSGEGNWGPPELYAIAPTGGEPERLGRLHHDEPLRTTLIAPAADGARIAYDYYGFDRFEHDGPWLSDLDGSRAGPAWNWDTPRDNSNIARTVMGAAFSPDGRYLLSIVPFLEIALSVDTESSAIRLTPLADVPTIPQTVNAEIGAVIGAGWLPASRAGAALVYLVHNPTDPDVSGLYVAAEPGAPGRQVLQGLYRPPASYWRMPLLWGEKNTILLADGNYQLVIITLGQ